MDYDIAIIGGGPAGYSAAFEASSLGMKTILFESSLLGGTCLNQGCVPTKFLLHAAEVYSSLNICEKYGIKCNSLEMNFSEMQNENYKIINELRNGLFQMLDADKVTIVDTSDASIKDKHHISADNTLYETDNILIATGSVPNTPFVPGAVTSDVLLRETAIPKSITIIGGGVVAIEFAWLLNSLGSNVTMKIRGERILRKWDRELAVGIQQILKRRGITLLTRCSTTDMCKDNNEYVLSAIGRMPRIPLIEGVNIGLGKDGGIVTDEFGNTSEKGIYAAGDVISGSYKLAHVAMEQGKRAVQHIAGKAVGPFPTVVSCIYTTPEIASVGDTEEAAKCRGLLPVSAKQPMSGNARTAICFSDRSFVKLIAENENHRIIGAQLMCERAGDIASELALAINSGLTAEQLKASLRPHPSFCEAITDAASALCRKLMKV